MSESNILDLPDEIIVYLSVFLEIEDVLRFRKTCKLIYSLINIEEMLKFDCNNLEKYLISNLTEIENKLKVLPIITDEWRRCHISYLPEIEDVKNVIISNYFENKPCAKFFELTYEKQQKLLIIVNYKTIYIVCYNNSYIAKSIEFKVKDKILDISYTKQIDSKDYQKEKDHYRLVINTKNNIYIIFAYIINQYFAGEKIYDKDNLIIAVDKEKGEFYILYKNKDKYIRIYEEGTDYDYIFMTDPKFEDFILEISGEISFPWYNFKEDKLDLGNIEEFTRILKLYIENKINN